MNAKPRTTSVGTKRSYALGKSAWNAWDTDSWYDQFTEKVPDAVSKRQSRRAAEAEAASRNRGQGSVVPAAANRRKGRPPPSGALGKSAWNAWDTDSWYDQFTEKVPDAVSKRQSRRAAEAEAASRNRGQGSVVPAAANPRKGRPPPSAAKNLNPPARTDVAQRRRRLKNQPTSVGNPSPRNAVDLETVIILFLLYIPEFYTLFYLHFIFKITINNKLHFIYEY